MAIDFGLLGASKNAPGLLPSAQELQGVQINKQTIEMNKQKLQENELVLQGKRMTLSDLQEDKIREDMFGAELEKDPTKDPLEIMSSVYGSSKNIRHQEIAKTASSALMDKKKDVFAYALETAKVDVDLANSILQQNKNLYDGEVPVITGKSIGKEDLFDLELPDGTAGKFILKNGVAVALKTEAGEQALVPSKDKDFAPQVSPQWKRTEDGQNQLGILDEVTGIWKPVKDDSGKPIIVSDEERKLMEGKKTESVSNFFGKGFETESGKESAKVEAEIVKSERGSQARIQTLENMNQLLDQFESGKLARWEKIVQQWGSALGFDVDTKNLSAKEAFTAITEQLALQSRNQGEGMVLAGQMSDKDVQFLRDMSPQLIISKGGNKLIIQMRKAIAKREMEIADLARQYKKEHSGMFDALDFGGYIKDRYKEKSVFGIPEDAVLVGTDKTTGLPVYKASDGKSYIPNF